MSIKNPNVQGFLMLFAYRQSLRERQKTDPNVKMFDLDYANNRGTTDKQAIADAMKFWYSDMSVNEQDDHSLSARFRDYLNDPRREIVPNEQTKEEDRAFWNETVNPRNESELAALYERVKKYEPATVLH